MTNMFFLKNILQTNFKQTEITTTKIITPKKKKRERRNGDFQFKLQSVGTKSKIHELIKIII